VVKAGANVTPGGQIDAKDLPDRTRVTDKGPACSYASVRLALDPSLYCGSQRCGDVQCPMNGQRTLTRPTQILTLRPHQSLSAKGLCRFFILTPFILTPVCGPVLPSWTVCYGDLLALFWPAVEAFTGRFKRKSNKPERMKKCLQLDQPTRPFIAPHTEATVKEWQSPSRIGRRSLNMKKTAPYPINVSPAAVWEREVAIGTIPERRKNGSTALR